jgi:hypothetical protein
LDLFLIRDNLSITLLHYKGKPDEMY